MIMEYEEIRLLKESERSRVQLVHEKDGEQVFVRKTLKGQCPVYSMLQNCQHPYLPKLYEVRVEEDVTTIIEEYIEGQALGSWEISEKQLLSVVRDVCFVLEFIHGKGIIHRDIKPSNIILAGDGHIRLIDFDAARMPKEDLDQDTRLLGTRGYAPPEQYGFAQTDERADIYALGVTLEQLLREEIRKPRYKTIIRKCTNLDPNKRYQSASQVKQAFFDIKRRALLGVLIIFLLIFAWNYGLNQKDGGLESAESGSAELSVLPAPDNPHWNGETGTGLWGCVRESGVGAEMEYHCKLYRKDTNLPPDPEKEQCYYETTFRGVGWGGEDVDIFELSFVTKLERNGFYYFEVCAVGDGIQYTDSPYVMSDAFEYTGEDAPPLPSPTGLKWKLKETEEGGRRFYYATWSNLDDYEDDDSFNVTFYDKDGNYVMNNIWTKRGIIRDGNGGITIRPEFLTEEGSPYRFTVQAQSSRPNEYQSSFMPEVLTEEYYSPWLYS